MGDVAKFYPKDSARNPDAVLEQAAGKYESVFIIGRDKDGVMDTRASTSMEYKDILWLIETFKHKLLNGDYFQE